MGERKLCYSAYCCKALQSAASSLLNPFYICFVICHKWGWPFIYIPAQRAQIADLTKQNQQAEIFSLLQTMGAIGTLIGPLIGTIFYKTHPEYVFTVQSIALIVYAVVVWTQLPETAPAMTTPTQKFEVTSPKQFVHKHYAVFGLMISTLPISFFMHKLRRIILFSRNIIFRISNSHSFLFQHAKLLWKSFCKFSS